MLRFICLRFYVFVFMFILCFCHKGEYTNQKQGHDHTCKNALYAIERDKRKIATTEGN